MELARRVPGRVTAVEPDPGLDRRHGSGNRSLLLSAGAAIVTIRAVVGRRGSPGDVAYGSAKAGMVGLTRTLAVELAPHGVRLNLVVPGFVDAAMTAGLADASRSAIVDGIPMGRPLAAGGDRRRGVVAAASYMAGATVAVDGGLLSSFGAPRR